MRYDGWWKIVNNLMRNGPSSWGYTTGLPTAKFADLLIRLREEGVEDHPPSPGLRDSLRAAPIRTRHNVIQAVIGEQLSVCRPTISRVIKAMTGAIVRALRDVLLTAEEMPRGATFVWTAFSSPAGVGGITANCGRGEYKATGMSARILVLPGGRPVRASDPCSGPMHDVAAPGAFRTARGNRHLRVDRRQGLYRKGNDHPSQEAPNGKLSEAAKKANRSINRIRRAERADHRPHQVLENPPAPTTGAPCAHSSRPSPTHSHSTPSKPHPE